MWISRRSLRPLPRFYPARTSSITNNRIVIPALSCCGGKIGFTHITWMFWAAWCLATMLAEKGAHPSTAQKMLGHCDLRMTLEIYGHPRKGCKSPPQPRLPRPFLEPAVDTSQKNGFGSSVESLYFSAICRTFRSGGTRIRTGDTMIFSPRAHVRVRPIPSWYVA